MKDIEIRNIISTDLTTTKIEEVKKISGYINKFNERSEYMGFFEIVEPTAFDKTLADGHNVYALYDHNTEKILGSTKAGTLKLEVDNIGLKFELIVNDDITYINDLYELIKSGDVDGCSFGFYCVDDSWTYTEEGQDLRILKEVELNEVTITPFPAYKATTVSCRSYEKHKEEIEKTKELRALEKELELLDIEEELR